MKKIISAKDVETLLRQGKTVDAITADAILTPSAMADGVKMASAVMASTVFPCLKRVSTSLALIIFFMRLFWVCKRFHPPTLR